MYSGFKISLKKVQEFWLKNQHLKGGLFMIENSQLLQEFIATLKIVIRLLHVKRIANSTHKVYRCLRGSSLPSRVYQNDLKYTWISTEKLLASTKEELLLQKHRLWKSLGGFINNLKKSNHGSD